PHDVVEFHACPPGSWFVCSLAAPSAKDSLAGRAVEEEELAPIEHEAAAVADGDLLVGVDLGDDRSRPAVVEEDDRLVAEGLEEAHRRRPPARPVAEAHVLGARAEEGTARPDGRGRTVDANGGAGGAAG